MGSAFLGSICFVVVPALLFRLAAICPGRRGALRIEVGAHTQQGNLRFIQHAAAQKGGGLIAGSSGTASDALQVLLQGDCSDRLQLAPSGAQLHASAERPFSGEPSAEVLSLTSARRCRFRLAAQARPSGMPASILQVSQWPAALASARDP